VLDGRAKVTNLPWHVDARAISTAFSIARVTLVNDLVALAYGTLTVAKEKLRVLGANGMAPVTCGENIAVIAAGTGLGEAALVWDGMRYVPLATEGGHTDFAPRTREESELLFFLGQRFGHVSYERVLSGPGLSNLYDFFVEGRKASEPPPLAARIASAPDRNQEIARLGASGESATCRRVLELFASLYGAEASNLALKTFATGGVFVCGGIAAKYADFLAENRRFADAFCAKGRFKELVSKIPVAIVLDTDIGLAGSAYHAASAALAV
jgi:glucokinase